MRRALWVGALLLGLAAFSCSDSGSDSIVYVTVVPAANMPPVTQLRATLSFGSMTDTELFPKTSPSAPISFNPNATFVLLLPRSRVGVLGIAVDAIDATPAIVAHGENTVSIVVGGQADVTIVLARGTGDGGVSDAGSLVSDGGLAERTPSLDGPADEGEPVDLALADGKDTLTGFDEATDTLSGQVDLPMEADGGASDDLPAASTVDDASPDTPGQGGAAGSGGLTGHGGAGGAGGTGGTAGSDARVDSGKDTGVPGTFDAQHPDGADAPSDAMDGGGRTGTGGVVGSGGAGGTATGGTIGTGGVTVSGGANGGSSTTGGASTGGTTGTGGITASGGTTGSGGTTTSGGTQSTGGTLATGGSTGGITGTGGTGSGGQAYTVDTIDLAPTTNESVGTSTTGAKFNFYATNAARTLVQIEMFLKPEINTPPISVPLTWYVFESASQSGPWTSILPATTTNSTTSQGYQSSGPINVPLLNSHYYAIGVQWATPLGYWFHTAGTVPVSFGTLAGGAMLTETTTVPATSIVYGAGSYYAQRLTTIP